MTKLKVGLLYLSLHNQLTKKYGYTIITRKELFTKLGKHNQIPKNLRPMVIKEMCKMKLIEVINRDRLQILKPDEDLEEIFKSIWI